jgi:hypothetical protein
LKGGSVGRCVCRSGATAETIRLMSTVALFPLLAVRRETTMIAAFIGVVVSGLIVSIGAWILLVRERRAARREREA